VNALGARIVRLIEGQGPLSVAQYMTLALHDPREGYYTAHTPFGRTGDFITAPEISQMFGELIGLWAAECWHAQGAPAPARLMELGPGRGTLMKDALRAIARAAPEFAKALDVVLIETSPALCDVQRETLRDAGVPIEWKSGIDAALADRALFVIANEFFDALPIRQYVKTETGWPERMVVVDNNALAFALAPVAATLDVPQTRGEADEGAVYEVSPSGTALAEELAQMIAGHGGAALIVDYGHEGIGFGDTLQAVKAHKFAKVLEAPGEADLSAHVDFAGLASAVARGGARAYGPLAQGAFLERLGLRERAAQLAKANPTESNSIKAAAARLMGADEMGTLFKALAILPETAPAPPGF